MARSVPNRIQLDGSYTVRIKAVFNSGTGKLLNLSMDGAYVATPMYLLPQAQVHLQIVLPAEKRWVETQAVVAWENRGTVRRRGLPPGYGLRFIKVPEETAEALRELLRGAALPATDSVPVSGSPAPPAGSPSPQPAGEVKSEIPPDLDMDFGVSLEPDGPPYRLVEEVLRARLPEGAKGVFVLSYDRTQDARVGRSDDDLLAVLSGFVGEYAYFYYELIEAQRERFHRECELYHRLGGDHGQLDNTAHPSPPVGSDIVCPVCAAGSVHP